MNTIMMDKMKLESKHDDYDNTILSILGSDANTKYTESLKIYQTSAIDTISIGG